MNRPQMINARSAAHDLADELSAILAVEKDERDTSKVKTKFYTEHAFEALQKVAAEMGFGIVALASVLEAAE